MIMDKDLIIVAKSEFISASYSSESDSWHFVFADRISFTVSAMWRLLFEKHIRFVSFDNKQQFGLPKPIDLAHEVNKILSGKTLVEIKVQHLTSDLLLTITDNIQIEIFTSSSGYETYSFAIGEMNYIGMGSGYFSMYDSN